VIAFGAFLGVLASASLLLLVYGLRPPAPRLAEMVVGYNRALHGAPPRPVLTGWSSRLTGAVADAFIARGWLTGRQRADLDLLDTSPFTFVTTKTGYALAGVLSPGMLFAAVATMGADLPPLVPAWLSLTCGLVAFLIPDLRLRATATAVRRDFRVAVGAYLDLVAMRMASGAGLAEALTDAAQLGSGPVFARLRGALADARTDGLTPAAALGRLGSEIALPDLIDVAARLTLVDTSGAQAEASLRAQAASVRDRDLSESRGAANERSQSMLVAQVVLGFGFLIFLGYPAIAKVLTL
jgi:tight adherence protein C